MADQSKNPKPMWRWLLWKAAFELWWATEWSWAERLHTWCILPEWLGYEPGTPPAIGEDPF